MKNNILCVLISVAFTTTMYGAQIDDRPEVRHGSLWTAFEIAQEMFVKDTARQPRFVMHYFDAQDEEWEKKWTLFRLFSSPKPIEQECMQSASKSVVKEYRKRHESDPDIYQDVIIADLTKGGCWLATQSWENFKPGALDVACDNTDRKKQGFCIYNIADTTLSTPEQHAQEIDTLRKKGNVVVVNVAKSKWRDMYYALEIDKRENEVVWIGEKPQSRLMRALWLTGATVTAAALFAFIYRTCLS